MNKVQKRIASVIAAGSVLLQLSVPALASTTIQISGNGVDTDNKATVDVDQSTYVQQTNVANINNMVDAEADTGKNDANSNTGGDVDITTGNATTNVTIDNTANSNSAEVDCCGTGDVDVLISGNGDDSDNHVDLDVNDDDNTGTLVVQTNVANMANYVDAEADTGKNDANSNTGGEVEIHTGNATVDVDVSNTANANSASVGGNGESMSLSAKILENGVDTVNDIDLDFDRSVWVEQDNLANIHNVVLADADTGKNDANSNTAGEVEITTGNAKAMVGIDNMVNFNSADLGCGCLLDVTAKIAGNGDDSDNLIDAHLDDVAGATQSNLWMSDGFGCGPMQGIGCLDGDDFVLADADTGKNDANSNTGEVGGGDPSIATGNATTDVGLSNMGNANYAKVGGDSSQGTPDYGDLSELFEDLDNLEVNFGFNMSFLWLLFSGMMS